MSTSLSSAAGPHTARSENWPWFKSSVGPCLTPSGRKLFEEYSGIAPSEVENHILKIRELAWEIFPWPCIGEFWFVTFGLSLHPFYPKLLSRLRSSPPTTTFLDLGTCLGQDLRKLVYDGVPLNSMYGSDMFAEYESIGHALFGDESVFKGRFITADLFDEASDAPLVKTKGTWDIININMFLHVFNQKDQVRSCKRILELLSEAPGSMVIGAQTASIEPGDHVLKPPHVAEGEHKSVYRQSRETFRKMWEEVGEDQGIDLNIWVEYEETNGKGQEGYEELFFTGNARRHLLFVVERL